MLIKILVTHADQISKQLNKTHKEKMQIIVNINFLSSSTITKSFGNVWETEKTFSSLLVVWTYGRKSCNGVELNVAL